jgi:hypothetical protein
MVVVVVVVVVVVFTFYERNCVEYVVVVAL